MYLLTHQQFHFCFLETEFLDVVLAILEPTMFKMASNSERSTCLGLLSGNLKGKCHIYLWHIWLCFKNFISQTAITNGAVDTWSLCHYLWPRWCPRDVPPQGPCRSSIPVLPPRTVVMSNPDYCQGPCLGSWLYDSWTLSWYPWLLLPPRAVQRSAVQAETWGYVGLRGSNCCPGHKDLGGPCCHLESWCHLVPKCGRYPCLGSWLYRSQGVGLCPRLLFLSKAKRIPGVWAATWVNVGFWSHAATRTMPIWLICSAN